MLKSCSGLEKDYIMLMPININSTRFCADKDDINPLTGEYSDPLMRWPIRGAVFTNEIGEALRPVIGNYATLSWAPALLYIGADIYDKYKNDCTEYSPDSRRGLKQAIFQGLASIALPLVAVKAGQNLFSLFGLKSKDSISYNAQEQISNIAEEFIANGKMHKYRGKDDECVKDFLDIVKNNFDFKRRRNYLSKEYDSKKNLEQYAEKTITDLIDMQKNLLNPSGDFINSNWHKLYENSCNSGKTNNVAIKHVLTKFQSIKCLKGKIIKTIGGFTLLGLSIKPIDHFVEEYLIGRVVGPSIEKHNKT